MPPFNPHTAGQLPRDAEGVPLYTVRVSQRARQVRLELSPREGVVLVLPVRVRPESAREFVRQKQGWLEAAWTRLGLRLAAWLPTPDVGLPPTVELRALAEVWTVEHGGLRHGRAGWEAILETRTLHVFAADADSAKALLRHWLVVHAKSALPPWLRRVAAECAVGDVPPHKNHGGTHAGWGKFQAGAVTVRLLSSRWGSCAANGRICLNAKLLFLPPAQVRYVIVHELCHRLHLDHSERFWDAVERFEPYAFELRKKLHHASRYTPGWVEE